MQDVDVTTQLWYAIYFSKTIAFFNFTFEKATVIVFQKITGRQ
jgi:hypothetical protein